MIQCRKTVFLREEISATDLGDPGGPITRVALMAVVRNPLAGRSSDDLSALFEIGAALGAEHAQTLVSMLSGPAVAYGKAAIVGAEGEMEHGGGIIHPRLGTPMRAACGGGEAVIPSNVKVGAIGAAIDLPLGHKDNPWSFDHFDTMTLSVPDGPRADEILVCLAYADGGRLLPRCGPGPVKG